MRAALLIITLATLACSAEPLEPLPLEIALKVEPATAAVGDSVRVEITAQGGRLLGVTVEYGDGGSEALPAAGARTARATYRHAYTRSGVYEVAATVTDALQGDKSARVNVQVR